MKHDLPEANTINKTTIATVYFSCSSTSKECLSECGALLHTINRNTHICPNCSLTIDKPFECLNSYCHCTTSPRWYNVLPNKLCSACYLYKRRTKVDRPQNLWKNNNKAVADGHFTCKWKARLIMAVDQPNVWKLQELASNQRYHHFDPQNNNCRPTLNCRDRIDSLRISTCSKSTADLCL